MTSRAQARALASPSAGVLAVNAGSSSVRFAVFDAGAPFVLRLSGKLDRLGLAGAELTASPGRAGPVRISRDRPTALRQLLAWLEDRRVFEAVRVVGHRIVQGMTRTKPERVTARLLADLHSHTAYDPDHLPLEIELMEAIRSRHPRLPQVACFDTAFHRDMPAVARLLPIPWKYGRMGVERYGFHGISYEYLMGELARLDPRAAARGRVILAHLGNGASLAAVKGGRSRDTSMGFTPAAGLVMSTRTGDLDPGLLAFMARRQAMGPAGFERMVNHESGLLGVSGFSSDMRDLLRCEKSRPRAAAAIELFCYQARKWIGAYAAALGGLDTLVFAGGIGENAPEVRARICEGLGFLGVRIDARRNAGNAPVISTRASRVTVRMIRTDEELMIARSAWLLGLRR